MHLEPERDSAWEGAVFFCQHNCNCNTHCFHGTKPVPKWKMTPKNNYLLFCCYSNGNAHTHKRTKKELSCSSEMLSCHWWLTQTRPNPSGSLGLNSHLFLSAPPSLILSSVSTSLTAFQPFFAPFYMSPLLLLKAKHSLFFFSKGAVTCLIIQFDTCINAAQQSLLSQRDADGS